MKEDKFFNSMGPCDPSIHYMMKNETALARTAVCLKAGGLFWHVSAKGTGKSTFLHQCFEMMGISRTVICLNMARRDREDALDFKTLFMTRLYEAFYHGELLHPSKKLTAWIKMQKISLGEPVADIDAGVWFSELLASCTKPVVIVLEDVDWLINDPAYQAFVRDIVVNTALGRYKRFALLLTGCHKVLPEGDSQSVDVQRDELSPATSGAGFVRLPLVLKYDTDMINGMLLQAGVEVSVVERLGNWLYEMTGGHAGLIVKIIQGMVMDHEIHGDMDWSPDCGMRSVAGILKTLYPVD